jgi:ABC-type ATPase involved in cell division
MGTNASSLIQNILGLAYSASHTHLGEDVSTGDDVDIADQDRYSGLYILGKQGTGKSSLLQWLIYQDIANKDTAVIVVFANK